MENHCPTCKGTGKIQSSITYYGSNKVDHFEIDCIDCNGGKKPMTQLQGLTLTKQRAAEKKLWCSCDGDNGATYVDNNVSKVCSKHHWICNKCKKILQVG